MLHITNIFAANAVKSTTDSIWTNAVKSTTDSISTNAVKSTTDSISTNAAKSTTDSIWTNAAKSTTDSIWMSQMGGSNLPRPHLVIFYFFSVCLESPENQVTQTPFRIKRKI